MDLNIKSSELEIFLCDISVYLRNELQLFQYENTLSGSNELMCKNLLLRCEKLLKGTEPKRIAENCHSKLADKLTDVEEGPYLDMRAARKAIPRDYIDFNGTLKDVDSDIENDDKEIYDTCNTSLQQTIKSTTDDNETIDCPYIELPASHLNNIQKPSKQGQLIRIEKRLFFDQTKKLYCGIVKDWLLCYGEGLSSIKPLFCIKLNKIEVEHTGEGKRRDLCFQIINTDTGKRFVFQATSDIDSKEWIHAIEAALRGGFNSINIHDSTQINLKTFEIDNNTRKLPTPPVQNKIYTPSDTINDDIYEEPCPLYINSILTTENIKFETDEIPPILPAKAERIQKNRNSDYDVPNILNSIISSSESAATIAAVDAVRNKTEFRTKVKDVHSKLTNQLSSGINSTKTKKLQEPSVITDVKSSGKLSLIYNNKDKTTISLNPANGSTPVKNWFFNRLNKSSSATTPGISSNYSSKSSPNKQEKENLLSHDHTNNNAINVDCPKGGKVNMIINHLETNGHMPIFEGNFERLNSSLIDNIDDYNYEPIMASGN